MYCLRPSCHDTTKWSILNFMSLCPNFGKGCQIVKSSFGDRHVKKGLQIPWRVHPVGQGATSVHFAFHPLSLGRSKLWQVSEGFTGGHLSAAHRRSFHPQIWQTITPWCHGMVMKLYRNDFQTFIQSKQSHIKVSSIIYISLKDDQRINIQQTKIPCDKTFQAVEDRFRRGAGKVTVPRPCSRPWRQRPTFEGWVFSIKQMMFGC